MDPGLRRDDLSNIVAAKYVIPAKAGIHQHSGSDFVFEYSDKSRRISACDGMTAQQLEGMSVVMPVPSVIRARIHPRE